MYRVLFRLDLNSPWSLHLNWTILWTQSNPCKIMIEFFRRQTDFECVFSLGLLADDHLDGGTGIEPTVQHVPAAQSVVHRRDLARRPQPRFADPLWPAGSSAVHQQNLRRRPERAASTKIRHGRAIHRFLLMRTTWDYFFIFFLWKSHFFIQVWACRVFFIYPAF